MTRWIVGNWKMNGSALEGAALVQALRALLTASDLSPEQARLAICPPFTLLHQAQQWLDGSDIWLGGQDCHDQEKGAFTGQVSAGMLRDAGCRMVILGHSERRHLLGETSQQVAAKAAAALKQRLMPIICIGETLAERQAGQTLAVLAAQLEGSLPKHLPENNGVPPLLIAYEPVWAIGTGLTASLEQIAEVHQFLKQQSPQPLPVLYGGSVKAGNAPEILSVKEVGGLLVGGASLNAEEFWQIAKAAG
jgi:triosephosphate isomerase